jgi:uncharacterized OsmC-like protein
MTTATIEKPAKQPMNGVDVPTLLATIGVVGGNPDLAQFQFRAKGKWVRGTHSRAAVSGFYGAGQEHERETTFTMDGDHPTVLCGTDNGPAPVEYLLSALAACLTAGIGNIASARQIELHSVESEVEGDIDMQGLLGLDDQVRNGFNAIRVTFRIAGDADTETLRKVVEQSMARSAVLDMLRSGTNVDVQVA